jgi:hypothetical protein
MVCLGLLPSDPSRGRSVSLTMNWNCTVHRPLLRLKYRQVLTHCSNLFVSKQTTRVSNFASPYVASLYKFDRREYCYEEGCAPGAVVFPRKKRQKVNDGRREFDARPKYLG